MPGTKIRGLLGFNKLSSISLFDIYIENIYSAKPFCHSVVLLYYCLFRRHLIFRKRKITTLQENSKTVTEFQNLTGKSAREVVDNFLHSPRELPIIALDMEFICRRPKVGLAAIILPSKESMVQPLGDQPTFRKPIFKVSSKFPLF